MEAMSFRPVFPASLIDCARFVSGIGRRKARQFEPVAVEVCPSTSRCTPLSAARGWGFGARCLYSPERELLNDCRSSQGQRRYCERDIANTLC